MTKKKDPNRCIEMVFPASGGFTQRQCSKKNGQGKDGQYCSEHARSTKDIAPSNDKRKARDRLWR